VIVAMPTKSTDATARHRARHAAASRDQTEVAPARVFSPLTGRDTEVGLIRDRWEQAQEGMGQVVLIVGEAGLGKSRLVQTIRQKVQDAVEDESHGSPIIEWRCADQFQSTELFPLTDYLQRVLNFSRDESPTARFDCLAQYLDDHGLGRAEVVSLFAKLLFLPSDERFPATDLSPVREREETFRAVHEWLHACSQRQPVLFVVEDLHWIDASSLEFLTQFIAEGLHDRILTVFTFRPEFRTPWPAVSHQTSLALNRLTKRQVAELLRKSAGSAPPDSLVTQIYERTRGVPLLVEEFGRMAQDYAQDHEMPDTLQELMIGRLDRLTSRREVAHYAATLGREFQFEMLAAVAGLDESALRAELAKLERAEIIFGTGHPPDTTYQFKHALLEEAVRGALDEEGQRQLHLQVAEALEAKFPRIVERQPERLAHHFTEANLAEKAVGYWLEAGRRSQERFANVEAISQLIKGLGLLRTLDQSPSRNVQEVKLLGPLGTAYIAARGYAAPEVGPIFQRACELASGFGRTPEAFTMLRGFFAYQIVRGNFRHCTELAAEAMQFAREAADDGMMMEALFLEAITQFYRGDFAHARDGFARAIANYDDRERTAFWAARTGENTGVTHRCYLALASWHLGSPDRALAINAEARELARTIHHPFSLEYALHHTGWLHQHCRLANETEAAGREEMQVATEQGFVFWLASGRLFQAAGLLVRGRIEEGLRLFQNALADYRATGAILGLPYYLSILAEALTKAHRYDEARLAFDEAFELVEENDDRFQEAELHRLRGELHLAEAHDEPHAARCFQSAIEIAREQGSRAWELRASVSLARLWQRQGRGHEALGALTAVFDSFTEGFDSPDLADATALLRELGNERMRDEIAAGIKYVRDCIPPPMTGPVSVDWRYIPSTTLGGDAIGYHWLDQEHLALYLIDVTGHGLDSALLAVTITNVIRAGSISGADLRRPEQVLAALNDAFQGSRHGKKFFTLWYGVYHTASRTLMHASGGHPPAIVLATGETQPLLLPATGSIMGIAPGARYPAIATPIERDARLYIFSDGVWELRRERQTVWSLSACITEISSLKDNVMDSLIARARELRGTTHLDDDFSIIEACLH
jgi:serine phosphatase RsbU (regulator of sigma subunit)